MRQESFLMTGYFDKGKKTKRERFLGEMEQVLPWVRLLVLIEPYYPKNGSWGRRKSAIAKSFNHLTLLMNSPFW